MKTRLLLFAFPFIILLALSPSPVHKNPAQNNDLKFEFVFNLGAPGSQAIMQDNQGFIWLGSAGGGLFRYDGYEFHNYKTGDGGLSNSYVYGIIEDPSNNDIIWVATKEGLNRFDRRTETFNYFKNDPDDSRSLSHDAINDIVQDSYDENILWVATEYGLNRFNKNEGTFQHYFVSESDDSSCNAVWRVIEDHANPEILWLGTWGCGLAKLNKKTGALTYYMHDDDNFDSFAGIDNTVPAIIQDYQDENILWLGTIKNGLEKFHKNDGTFSHFRPVSSNEDIQIPAMVGMIYDDHQGRLWIGSYRAETGLFIFDKTNENITHFSSDDSNTYSLAGNAVVELFEDNTGIKWITDYAGNVSKIDPYSQKFFLFQKDKNSSSGLSNSSVTTIFEDSRGSLWVGTQDGLNKLKADSDIFIQYFNDTQRPGWLTSGFVFDVVEDFNETLWVSFFNGPLINIDTNGKVIQNYLESPAENFTQIVVDPQNTNLLWAGTRNAGFSRFDMQTGEFKFYTLDSSDPDAGPGQNFIYTVLHDRDDDVIWMGGWEGGGLNLFDKKTERFIHYYHNPGNDDTLSANAVADIFQDSSGNIWIGTIGGGLNLFHKDTGTFTCYAQEKGVPAVINSIQQDDEGFLWLSSDDGIVEFDPLQEIAIQQFHHNDGLQGEQFTYGSGAKSQDGYLLFGGINGLNVFDPKELSTNPNIPPIILTGFTQGGIPVTLDENDLVNKSIVLDWQSNFFEFEYVALNFTHAQDNHYAYMLEGFDSDWFDAGTKRYGRYTSLPPGNYILRIKGSNNNGVWNEAGVAVEITIIPPIWKTWWFYTLVSASILGVFLIFYRTKSRQLKTERKAAEVIRTSEERLALAIMGGELGLWDWNINESDTIEPQPWSHIGGDHIMNLDDSTASWQSLLHEDDLKLVLDELQQHLNGMTHIYRSEYRLRTREGGWKWIQDTGKIVERDESGCPVRMAGVHIDISERKRMEEIMMTSQKLAELGALSAGIAHEINSPLQIITGISESLSLRLSRTNLNAEELLSEIDKINRNGWRIARIVRSLLTFARSSAMQIDIFDLNEIVQDTLLLIEHQLRSWSNIEVETHLEENLPFIQCDRNSIAQVIINLITNARDAMPMGGEIIIDTCFDTHKSMFEMKVSDNGTGMSDETMAKIFDPFYTTKPVGKGTGLGMSIVMGIIRSHGGHIIIESNDNQGTTICIFLPERIPPNIEIISSDISED